MNTFLIVPKPLLLTNFRFLHMNTLVCFHNTGNGRECKRWLFLFTHVIFEVGAGAAQQKDTGALGMAVLAGQVQSRVPRLGERQTEGGTC